MSFAFHHNKPLYFEHQYLNTKEHVIPYITSFHPLKPEMQVLEIGCAEGGVLKAFVEIGCVCTGIELSESKVANAQKFMASEIENGSAKFICKNIYDVDFEHEYSACFDIIVLKDTIEHIPNQALLIGHLRNLLKKNGVIFLGFPPWASPWGGHQQICNNKFLMYLPWFHLMPMSWYKFFLKTMGETSGKISELVEIKETGISTIKFEKIIKKHGYHIINRTFFLINPIYKYKFGLLPAKLPKIMSTIPVLNNFLSTTVYYLIK